MAFEFGQFNEFSDPTSFADPVILAIAKTIELNPFVGQFYQSMGSPETSIKTKAFEIYTRTSTSRDGSIPTAWGASGATGLAMSADALKGLTIGHVISIDGETVIIASVDRSANTISVLARGAGGTTAKAHTAGTAFKLIGFAGNDADLKLVESMNETTTTWENYVQTVFEVFEWSKHGELMRKGLSAENATQILTKEAEIRVATMLSRMAILGIKQKATGATERYMSAGLIQQLADTTRGAYTYAVDGLLTETHFQTALKKLFDAGGSADSIWVSLTQKPWIDAFLGSYANRVITDSVSNHTAGGIYVDKYNYQGKILSVKVDADIPDGNIAIVQSSDCKKGWLEDDGLAQYNEPQQSSRETRKSLQGSVGFAIENVGLNHILLTGITGGSEVRTLPVNVTNSASAPVNITGTVTSSSSEE